MKRIFTAILTILLTGQAFAGEPPCECPTCRAGLPKNHWGRLYGPETSYKLMYERVAQDGRSETMIVGPSIYRIVDQWERFPSGFKGIPDGVYNIHRRSGVVMLAPAQP